MGRMFYIHKNIHNRSRFQQHGSQKTSFVKQGRAWMFARLTLHNAVPGKTADWNVGGRRSGQPTCWRTVACAYRQNKLVALAISLGFGVAVLDDHLLNSCQYGSKVRDTVTTTCRFFIRCAAAAGQCAWMQHEPWQIKIGVGRNTQAPKFLKTASQCFSVARPLGIASTTLLADGANLLISLHHYKCLCPAGKKFVRVPHQKILFG